MAGRAVLVLCLCAAAAACVTAGAADASPAPELHQHRVSGPSTTGPWMSCYVTDMANGLPIAWDVRPTPVVDATATPPMLAPWGVGEGARAQFNDTYTAGGPSGNGVGWAFLHLVSNPGANNYVQSSSAGYLEGQLTATRIFQYAMSNGGNESMPDDIREFLAKSRAWLLENIAANGEADEYWHQASLWHSQLSGIELGFRAGCSGTECSLIPNAVFNINLGNSISTLGSKFNVVPPSVQVDHEPVLYAGDQYGHCTGFVKLTDDGQELYIGHDTWSNFNSMLRVFKTADLAFLQLDGSPIPGRHMTWASYPGVVYSGDDYYTMSSGLVVAETTIGTNNVTSYDLITYNTVFEEARNMIANRLATDGESWAETFGAYNSGCYNNEFYIVDYNKFTPGAPLEDGLLTVLEQLPGFVEANDVTYMLREKGWFGSDNEPLFPMTVLLSNNSGLVDEYGTWFTYNGTARSLMMDRDHGLIKDVDSMKAFMRYNDFKHDPLARCACDPPYTGENAIACRSDLNPANGTWDIPFFGQRNHAAIDTKFTSSSMFADGQSSWVISSPTYDQQPVFVWSTSPYADSPHLGQPDRFEFPWVVSQLPEMNMAE